MKSSPQFRSRSRSKSQGRRHSSSNVGHVPSSSSRPKSRSSTHRNNNNSSNNNNNNNNNKPLIDMNSIQPFSTARATTGGASTALTRTTAATSGSSSEEESKSGVRSVRSVRDGSRRRRTSETITAGPSSSRRAGRSEASPRGETGTRRRRSASVENRGRSCSRPRTANASSSSRGRQNELRRSLVLASMKEDAARGRSRSRLRREADRGRSLGPLGSGASVSSLSMSRGRRTTSITRSRGHSIGPSASRSSARSRSQSTVRPLHLRTSKRASMETMEEERDDEDVSEKHLVYDPVLASHRAKSKNALRNGSRRSLSRSHRHADDSSKNNAAAAAIAAALHQIKKSQHAHESSRSTHSTSRPRPRDAQFTRKPSRSVSPRHKSRSKSINSSNHRPRQSSSFHLPSSSHDERSSVRSFHSSSSSSFSSYDRKIAKNFQRDQNRNVHPSSSSRHTSFNTKQHRPSHHHQQIQHKSSSDMAVCPDNNDENPAPSSPTNSSIEAAFQPLLDNDGCCIFHPFIQLQMKLPSGKWRTLSRSCVVCREEENVGGAGRIALSTTAHMPTTRRRKEGVASSFVAAKGESGECSLTPSVLEENDDDDEIPSAVGGGGSKEATASSSRGSVNSQIEHKKITTPTEADVHSNTDKLPPHEISFPSKLGSFDEESVKSKQSVDSSSIKESGSLRHSVHGIKQDDAKSTATPATRQHHEKKMAKQQSSADMSFKASVVDTALHKIRSMDEIHPRAAGETVPTSTRSHPPPPPPPRSQSSKNLPSKTQSKPMPPPPNSNSNASSLPRPPPPPPPPRPPAKTNSAPHNVDSRASPSSKTPPPPPPDTRDYDCSMAVLNPEPEPELQNDDFPVNDFDEMIPPFEQMEISAMMGPANVFPTAAATAATTSNLASPPKDWMKYCLTASAREGRDTNQRGERKSRLFGRNSARNDNNDRGIVRSVKQMPYTDQFGDFGLYTGQVNEDGRPDGKGSMKYDNGVFYEGTWTNGGQDQKAALQYERIRGGFTSWQGKGKQATKSGMVLPWNARKNDSHNLNEKTNVRGMEWTDLNGDSGRYTGEVNADDLPHGHGIMKYDFGLIAEGEWNNGVLKENPQDRLMASAAIGSARSIGPGMSVGPGAHGFNAAASVMGGMSVGGPAASVFAGPSMYPMPYGGMNPMMMAAPAHPVSQFAMMAHQNAMMKSQMGMYAGGSVYGGASAYGGGSAYATSALGQAQVQGAQPANSNPPPMSEIKIS